MQATQERIYIVCCGFSEWLLLLLCRQSTRITYLLINSTVELLSCDSFKLINKLNLQLPVCLKLTRACLTIARLVFPFFFFFFFFFVLFRLLLFFCNQNMFNSFTLLFLYYIIHHFASLWSTIRAGFCNCICTMSFASFIEAVFDGFFQIMLTVLDLVVRCDMIVLPRWCCHLVLIS